MFPHARISFLHKKRRELPFVLLVRVRGVCLPW